MAGGSHSRRAAGGHEFQSPTGEVAQEASRAAARSGVCHTTRPLVGSEGCVLAVVVAFGFVFWTLDSTGALDAVSRTIDDVLGTGGFDLLTSLELSRVLGFAAVIASVEIVLVSALATLFAFLYNVTVGLTGGIEVVLSDN